MGNKIVKTVFCPFLVAIAIRIILVIIGMVLCLVISDKDVGLKIGNFETFSWEDSYGYWVIVVIATFICESMIWNDEL